MSVFLSANQCQQSDRFDHTDTHDLNWTRCAGYYAGEITFLIQRQYNQD